MLILNFKYPCAAALYAVTRFMDIHHLRYLRALAILSTGLNPWSRIFGHSIHIWYILKHAPHNSSLRSLSLSNTTFKRPWWYDRAYLVYYNNNYMVIDVPNIVGSPLWGHVKSEYSSIVIWGFLFIFYILYDYFLFLNDFLTSVKLI